MAPDENGYVFASQALENHRIAGRNRSPPVVADLLFDVNLRSAEEIVLGS